MTEPAAAESPVPPKKGLAIASLVCAIVGFLGCLPSAIAGLVMGILYLRKKNTEGRGLAIAGIVVGSVSTFISALFTIGFLIGFFRAMAAHHP